MEKIIKTSYELLAERSWTEFLKSLPFATTLWRIENYRDFISLRTTASILSRDSGRRYSLRQDSKDSTLYHIDVIEVRKDA